MIDNLLTDVVSDAAEYLLKKAWNSAKMRKDLRAAAEHLHAGGLVVFPTETVYGLGADAFNAAAVAQIYAAKERPGDNPLILHIANADAFRKLAHNPPDYAFALIDAFWPGPLTLVVRKNPTLPAWVGGHPNRCAETIGVRSPAHPVARKLLEKSGLIIAAPSANKAGKPSPTTLAHVLEDFPNPLESGIFPLDGGSSTVGLESTVVDITGEAPVILRPGKITAEQIFETAGALSPFAEPGAAPPKSPGMKYRHYAPRADMTVLSGTRENVVAYLREKSANVSRRLGFLLTAETAQLFGNPPQGIKILILGKTEDEIAGVLFARFREFDCLGVDEIFAEAVAEEKLGVAIMDRMRKASEGRIIAV